MIKFNNIVKKYKNKTVINKLNLEINKGELVVLIGASGCGKTTLLKMINGLMKPSSGDVIINNQNIKNLDIIKLRRKIGYVIQHIGLFPHKTIRENIEVILKVEKIENDLRLEKTKSLLNMVGLNPEEYMNRYPTELSGGQQQRIGVARAFSTDPDIILMDEPFSALDPITRSDLQDELVELQAKLKKTIIFVTHDMDEAIKIADKICIINKGEIVQYDTPENILKNPSDEFVQDFVGKNRIWASPSFIKVKDIMINKPITATDKLPVFKCLEKMREHKVDNLLIINAESKKFKGIVSAKYLRNLDDKNIPTCDVMYTESPTLKPDDSIIDAINTINEHKLSFIPVLNDEKLIRGMITKSSLLTTLSCQYIDMEVL